jgi:hypothetical protein
MRQLWLNFACRSLVHFFGIFPNLYSIRPVVQHIYWLYEYVICLLHINQSLISDILFSAFRVLFILTKSVLDNLFELIVLRPEMSYLIQSFKQRILYNSINLILNFLILSTQLAMQLYTHTWFKIFYRNIPSKLEHFKIFLQSSIILVIDQKNWLLI